MKCLAAFFVACVFASGGAWAAVRSPCDLVKADIVQAFVASPTEVFLAFAHLDGIPANCQVALSIAHIVDADALPRFARILPAYDGRASGYLATGLVAGEAYSFRIEILLEGGVVKFNPAHGPLTLPHSLCGNGIVEDTEECDPGVPPSGDADCLPTCQRAGKADGASESIAVRIYRQSFEAAAFAAAPTPRSAVSTPMVEPCFVAALRERYRHAEALNITREYTLVTAQLRETNALVATLKRDTSRLTASWEREQRRRGECESKHSELLQQFTDRLSLTRDTKSSPSYHTTVTIPVTCESPEALGVPHAEQVSLPPLLQLLRPLVDLVRALAVPPVTLSVLLSTALALGVALERGWSRRRIRAVVDEEQEQDQQEQEQEQDQQEQEQEQDQQGQGQEEDDGEEWRERLAQSERRVREQEQVNSALRRQLLALKEANQGTQSHVNTVPVAAEERRSAEALERYREECKQLKEQQEQLKEVCVQLEGTREECARELRRLQQSVGEVEARLDVRREEEATRLREMKEEEEEEGEGEEREDEEREVAQRLTFENESESESESDEEWSFPLTPSRMPQLR